MSLKDSRLHNPLYGRYVETGTIDMCFMQIKQTHTIKTNSIDSGKTNFIDSGRETIDKLHYRKILELRKSPRL